MNKIVLLLALPLALASCKKEEDEVPVPATPPPAASYDSYMPFTTGSYWVYQRYDVNGTTGAETATEIDSCYISGDTVIGGKTYHILMQPHYITGSSPQPTYLRDSLDYIVTPSRRIFSSQNFSTSLHSEYMTIHPSGDTLAYQNMIMTDQNLSVTVPAGTFITQTAKVEYTMWPTFSAGGTNRSTIYRYAKDVGMVEYTLPFFTSTPDYQKRVLLRYHIN
jgi:hypothetical protein